MSAAQSETLAWPASLAGTPSIRVIEQAIARRRLSHSLLLTGGDLETLALVAGAMADRLLNTSASSARFAPAQHPDCFHLRPAGKMRLIGADPTRELINKISVSPVVSIRKVAIIHECDRMNLSAANIFLKTLEEPPADTTILLLTTRPYALLPTIRSRCLTFRFPAATAAYSPDGWPAWLADYAAWLARLSGGEGVAGKRAITDSLMAVYGLASRFGGILEFATQEVWKKQKAALPPDIKEDEEVAIETGIINDLRLRLFTEIEQATRAFALPRLNANAPAITRALTDSIKKLEHVTGLLRLNLNESAALENFLLASLRHWTRR
ncbi:MAG: DNA polymerase III subunit gamma/tau, partial [Opitutaceae bacterium]|jgi:DNA polymerase-3 subunit delta'|nr:DNA polymerase III subunit gamma/tau [Opitutaceae bacterium]